MIHAPPRGRARLRRADEPATATRPDIN